MSQNYPDCQHFDNWNIGQTWSNSCGPNPARAEKLQQPFSGLSFHRAPEAWLLRQSLAQRQRGANTFCHFVYTILFPTADKCFFLPCLNVSYNVLHISHTRLVFYLSIWWLQAFGIMIHGFYYRAVLPGFQPQNHLEFKMKWWNALSPEQPKTLYN